MESLSQSASALLAVLSFFDPDHIPETLLIEGANGINYDSYPKAKSDYLDARSELIKAALVFLNSDTHELTIHRLVQDGVRKRLN